MTKQYAHRAEGLISPAADSKCWRPGLSRSADRRTGEIAEMLRILTCDGFTERMNLIPNITL